MLDRVLRVLPGRADRRTRRRALTPALLEGLERRDVPAVTLPPGFTLSVLVSGLDNPESMDVAPDGRIFINEPGGAIRVVKDGQLLAQPFDVLPVAANGQGVLAVTLDPKFAMNHYVYALYVAPSSAPGTDMVVNRLVRITAGGDTAVPGSEKTLYETPAFSLPPGSPIHDGAAMHFGRDGKLYISSGDLTQGALAQKLDNPFGKILRLNSDGTIPRDNPFYNRTTGSNRAIWAIGLRNPFTFAVQPGTGLMYINDVGENTWEEIDKGARGANYGWPIAEGPSTQPGLTSPIYAYTHMSQANPAVVAITGGVFYDPAHPSFPSQYVGKYFFEDFGNGWIHTYDPATGQVQNFASGLPNMPNDLDVDPSGNLYYLDYSKGTLNEISYHGSASSGGPTATIISPGAGQTVRGGQMVGFRGIASDGLSKALPASDFHWSLDVLSPAGVQPGVLTLDGKTRGLMRIPRAAGLAGIQYRLNLTVTEPGVGSTTVSTVMNVR
jgi:glucose/arabinose dehydrogenase